MSGTLLIVVFLVLIEAGAIGFLVCKHARKEARRLNRSQQGLPQQALKKAIGRA